MKNNNIHEVTNDCLKELTEWIYENEKPTDKRGDGGYKVLSAHFLLKHIVKNYNIGKKQ